MLKNNIFIVIFLVILLLGIDITFAGSSVLCDAGGRYGFGGGCCGDGIINGPGANGNGETCDAGFGLNDSNDLGGCYGDCTRRPYADKNFSSSQSNCSGNGDVIGGYCIFYGSPEGGIPYIASDDIYQCNGGNVEIKWKANFGTGSSERYSSVGNAYYAAACESPACNNSVLYGCSPGTAIDKYGNDWKCSMGGRWAISCSLATTSVNCAGSRSARSACSNGSKSRIYTITTNPSGGGTACPTSPETSTDGCASCTTTNGGVEICGDGIDQDCNGSDLSCPVSCDGTVGGGCNSSSPPSGGSCSAAPACNSQCPSGKILNGGACIDPYVVYSCTQTSCGGGQIGSAGTWTNVRTCLTSEYSYNPSGSYNRGNTVCKDGSAPSASQCQSTCSNPPEVTCAASFGTCNNGSATNLNDQTACGTSKTWTCGSNSCSINNGSCPRTDGQCDNSQIGGCTAGTQVGLNNPGCPGTYTWQCQGSGPNHTDDLTCNKPVTGCDPVDGNCADSDTSAGNQGGECVSGVPTSTNGSRNCGSNLTWTCNGINSGNPDSCNLPGICTPIDGDCNNTIPGRCNAGDSSNSSIATPVCGNNTVTWMCNGTNGSAVNESCSYTSGPCDTPIPGRCNDPVGSYGSCSSFGGFSNGPGTNEWTCLGMNNGSDAICRPIIIDPPRCGDLSINQSWEECDGNNGVPTNTNCRAAGQPGQCTLQCNGGTVRRDSGNHSLGCRATCTASSVCSNGNLITRDSLCDITTNYPSFGQCCNDGASSFTSSSPAGANKNGFSCNGISLVWNQSNGNCSSETISKRCDDWSGWPTDYPNVFGPNGVDRGGYYCRNNRCEPEQHAYVRVWMCNLTGSNLEQRCTEDMRVNEPWGHAWPEQFFGGVKVGRIESWDMIRNMYVGMLTSTGAKLINVNNPTNPMTSPWGEGVRYSWLTPGQNYHSYVTYDPNVIGMHLPPGRAQLYGPSSGAAGYGYQHQGTMGGATYGWSSLISPGTGLRLTMGTDINRLNYFFYCADPTGICPTMRSFHINVFHDKANDGIGESYAFENNPLRSVLVNIYDTGNVLVASGYTSDGNLPDYCGIGNGNYANVRSSKGSFNASLLSNKTYRVVIIPPSGYNSALGSAPAHYVGRDEVVFGCPNNPYGIGIEGPITKTILSGTEFTFDMPRDKDVYAKTRLSGLPIDMSLSTEIANPKLGYDPNEIITVRYTASNLGYQDAHFMLHSSIMTGMVPVAGSVTFSGSCPSLQSSNYYRNDSWNWYNNILSCGDYNGSSVNMPPYEQCEMAYVNGLFSTWIDNGGGPQVRNTFFDTPYPSNTSDLVVVDRDGYTFHNHRFWMPKGNILTLLANNGAYVAPGSSCEISVDYRITSTAIGSTYSYKSCILPRDEEKGNMQQGKRATVTDNCDMMQVRIGMPSCVLPGSLSGALLAGTTTRLASGAMVSHGSGIIAWADDNVAPGEAPYCQSEYRECNNGVFSGTFANPSCMKQCAHIWSGETMAVGVNPGSSITGWVTLSPKTNPDSCQCEQGAVSCSPRIITATGGAEADPAGRSYIGGVMVGPLSTYIYPITSACIPSPECTTTECAINNLVDLYEVHYTMSGNTVLKDNRVIDQVHPNICIDPSTFTGKLATNEVRITFYSGGNTSIALPGLTNITGSLMSDVSSGLICGPYVEYEFAKPLYPGAEGYFFYEYKIKESISVNPNANSGDNCVWIYRQDNTDYRNNSPLTEINALSLALLDPGDTAQRFANNALLGLIKFNPEGQLNSNNRVCVPPPTSICPPNGITQKFSIPLNLCGNGVQEVGEQCDDGHAPYMAVGGRNNDNGSMRYTGLNITDPLYNNYCKTSCELAVPLVCNWIASCNNSNIDSIQVGEQYPFWWNLAQPLAANERYNSGFTMDCSAPVHANKIMYGSGYGSPICTFALTNGLTTGGRNLYEFDASCFGTGETNIPMFDLQGDKVVPGDIPTQIANPNLGDNARISSVYTQSISTKPGTLKEFKSYLTGSQGSKVIVMSGNLINGQLGEYAISLTKITYNYCNATQTFGPDGSGNMVSSYIYSIKPKSEQATVCSNRFVVTSPYIVQEGSLLSTIPLRDFSDFYTTAKRLIDQTAEGTFSKGVKVNNTQVATYISMIASTTGSTNKEFVTKFIDKYTTLGAFAKDTISYTHRNPSTLSGVINPSYIMYKVPTREIYIYTGVNPLFLSDYAFNQDANFNSIDTFTIIAPYADVVVLGDLKERVVMILTKQDIRFAGGSLSESPQEVHGIFASDGYVGAQLKNDNSNQRWIDDGRLIVKGLLISSNIDQLSQQRRSVIKDWYDGTLEELGGAALIKQKRQKLIEGASLRIVPNPSLFTSPPPGATELLESLSVIK